ncbi:hypothetical protein Y032_0379g317 [Ancylostoma ceylanicum]|uniref:Uncharacterized protein n=1 Tax=Ancylostoma ceylanicum TaxID=53326 RepID=A0A016RT73_9BILA|nr:hypothetical protein Y032_0379g317 [Ancylostoma ceylanicum]
MVDTTPKISDVHDDRHPYEFEWDFVEQSQDECSNFSLNKWSTVLFMNHTGLALWKRSHDKSCVPADEFVLRSSVALCLLAKK